MRKQGRPKFDDDLIRQVKERFPGVHSKQGQQKLVYAIEAYQVLKDLPGAGFFWKLDDVGKKVMRRALLSEIGRFKDPETIRNIAIRVIEDQKYQPHSSEEWVQILRKVRLQKKTDLFLKGELSLVPCLAIRSFPHPGYGLVKIGLILELPMGARTHIAAPIRGKLPEGWRTIAFLADNAVIRYGGTEMGLPKARAYISLYRTAKEFFKVSLELDAPYAVAAILGNNLQKPSNEVVGLYESVLHRTICLRLRPETSGDRGLERARIKTNYLFQQETKAIEEEREAHSNPLQHFSRSRF